MTRESSPGYGALQGMRLLLQHATITLSTMEATEKVISRQPCALGLFKPQTMHSEGTQHQVTIGEPWQLRSNAHMVACYAGNTQHMAGTWELHLPLSSKQQVCDLMAKCSTQVRVSRTAAIESTLLVC